MTKRQAVVIRPHISGLDEYMTKVKRLSALLNEASSLYDGLREARFKVSYYTESPTLKSCPHPEHSPSPEETSTDAPQDGH